MNKNKILGCGKSYDDVNVCISDFSVSKTVRFDKNMKMQKYKTIKVVRIAVGKVTSGSDCRLVE